MTITTSVGTLGARDQQEQNVLDQSGLTRRLVTIEAIRAGADDNPNLTDDQCRALAAASDCEILDAIDGAARGVEKRLFALHDELQAAVVDELAPQ